LTNIVATCKITFIDFKNNNEVLDLYKISSSCKNSEYNPKRFPGVLIRISEPKVTARIFKTGKMVLLGAHSIEKANVGCKKIANIIRKTLNIDSQHMKMTEVTVNNIVGAGEYPKKISLQ
jgi:transcription initiation factor TFIID TATA-box-binding protein